MDKAVHFISGLPRSGSTLLASLLKQNPRFTANMTSPVGGLFNAMLRETSENNETAVFIDNEMRKRLLSGLFDAYYAGANSEQVVFDTNRLWTTKMPALTGLFPKAKFICCVRNPAWIMDSFECLLRRNPFELSGIFSYDPSNTVYSRLEGLAGGAGLFGFSFNALRGAVYGEHGDRVLLLRYESLTAKPLDALATIYEFAGEPLYQHDSDHIESNYDVAEFDARLGTPGLHDVRSKVAQSTRRTILPPDLFSRFEREAFWENPDLIPKSVRVF